MMEFSWWDAATWDHRWVWAFGYATGCLVGWGTARWCWLRATSDPEVT